MDYSPLLSIIVPVYNSEKYLKKCLNSIVYQTYTNIEIICVNDGSTDESSKIIEEFKSKDKRIKVINQENRGLAEARNTGIKNIKGEFVAFLDSDDWLQEDFYKLLISRICQDNSDIAVGETHYYYDDKISKNEWVNYYNFKNDKLIIKNVEDKQNLIYSCACWNKVYRTSLIKDNDLWFPKGLYIEDVPFTFTAICLSKKVSLVHNAILYYRQHNESIMSKIFSFQRIFDIFEIYKICDKLLDSMKLDKELKIKYNYILDNFKIFNLNGYYLACNKKYKKKFRKEFILILKKMNINSNPYLTNESKKIYKIMTEKKKCQFKNFIYKVIKKIKIFKSLFKNKKNRKL